MHIFQRDKRRPSPLDNRVMPLYKDFLKVRKQLVNNWVRSVINGDLALRDHMDLIDTRMDVVPTHDGYAPVIRIRPVMGEQNENDLLFYVEFFQTYTKLVNRIYQSVEVLDNRDRKSRLTEFEQDVKIVVVFLVNLLKLYIALGHFNKLLIRSEDLNDDSIEFLIDRQSEFHQTAKDHHIAHHVGQQFDETGDMMADIDSRLIGSFFQYVHRSRLLKELEA